MSDITIHEEMPGLYRVYGRRPYTCDGFDELVEWLTGELGRTYKCADIERLNKEIDELEAELRAANH